ncbi:MAG: ferrous iron transport protein A [Candidatus Odinarchaeota archaeon]
MKLIEIPFNQLAIIKSVNKSIAKRLAVMGIIPGSEVKIIRASPLGDPLELEIKNYNLSLRKSECKLIEVEVI